MRCEKKSGIYGLGNLVCDRFAVSSGDARRLRCDIFRISCECRIAVAVRCRFVGAVSREAKYGFDRCPLCTVRHISAYIGCCSHLPRTRAYIVAETCIVVVFL